MIRYTTMTTPVGKVAVAWRGDAIVSLEMAAAESRQDWESSDLPGGPVGRLKEAMAKRFPGEDVRRSDVEGPAKVVGDYFAGDVSSIERVRVDPGGTPFQKAVWKRLRRIPAGKTLTYGEIAAAAGSPGSARAAGGAVGSNPIAIVIPCHRVLGSDRKLTGFGGGLRRKRWLLRHEGAAFRDAPRQLSLL